MADNNKKSLHVKTGDRVIITAGKDKGKTGNIKKAIPSEGKVVVEGANVMIVCPSCEKPTRIKHAVVDGKKVRVCKKCGEQLDV